MLAGKIDALFETSVHENFLNPTRKLRLAHFANWARTGYPISPQFSGSDEEVALLENLVWLLEQLQGLAELGEAESSLDQFLVEEARGGYGVYSHYVAELTRCLQTP